MITILTNIFFKGKDINSIDNRKFYGSMCGILGICLNIFLFFIKYFAGVVSGSVAIVADAFNNLADAGSSFITLIGFVFAGKKPDPEHPFGHGRFEYVSGFVVSLLIMLMGIELLQSSAEKIFHPDGIDGSMTAILVLMVSVLIKLYMAFYNARVGRKIASSAMKATAIDSLSDSIATTVVLVSVIFMKLTGINIDGYCGVVVALFILYGGFSAAKDTISPLLGQSTDPEFVKKVEEMVLAHDEVCGIHDLIVHDYGPGRVMISLHAEVKGDGNIFELHDAIDRIEQEISEKLFCEAVIHLDPVETNNDVINEVKAQVLNKLKELNEKVSIHDFRMVTGSTHTNLIFDMVAPYEMKESKEEIKEMVENKIKELGKEYCVVVHIDRSYIK